MNKGNSRPLALIILDGWGVASTNSGGNAIAMAHTPYYDEICARYPQTSLAAAGESVGLERDAAGNAEVGHLNIGAGRVVHADATRISEAINTGEFFENPVLRPAFADAARGARSLHLIGLLSDAGTHASMESLYALLRMARREGIQDVFVHGILDGRDVPARSADIYVEALEIKMADIGVGRIATLCGRFFAMDSTEKWERTARAYTMLVHAEGERAADAGTAVRNSFLRGISDEFIAPIVLESEPGSPLATVANGDLVVFFNHRADTMRQLARFLAVPNQGSNAAKPEITTICLTEYDRSFGLPVAFAAEPARNVLANVLAEVKVSNYRIAETDRFQHISKFFNAGSTTDQFYEKQILVETSDKSNRENEPEMESFKVADRALRAIEADSNGLFIVNFAAPDIVAETGNLEKTVEAIQYVDTCLGGVLAKIRELNGVAVVTSSHGSCEEMLQTRGGDASRFPTSNKVPFHIVDDATESVELRDDGSLSDIAPTILGILGIEKPAEMTGSDLRII